MSTQHNPTNRLDVRHVASLLSKKEAQGGPWSNQEKLPDLCYTRLLAGAPGRRIGIIKKGESGYYGCDYDNPSLTNEQVEELVNHLNERLGVTTAQRDAMEIGSMFGWDVKGADPNVVKQRQRRRGQGGPWSLSKPKSIQIIGRRWFQRTYGNTYCTAEIWVDGAQVAMLKPRYGYGEYYEQMAWEWLAEKKYVKPEKYPSGGLEPPWRYCQDRGIQYVKRVYDVKRQRDL